MKTDFIYEKVTNVIIKKLETGVIPWQKPWNGKAFQPKNLISKRDYRGFNNFLLNCSGFEQPGWISFKQCKKLGGLIKKGAGAMPVTFFELKNYADEDGKIQKYPFIKYYNVFNLEQTEGLEHLLVDPYVKQIDFNPIPECEIIISNYKVCPEIVHKEQQAYYRPSEDVINIPKKDSFRTVEEYYATLFHEATHSTGHEKRLNRRNSKEARIFGDSKYSKEELVAEMGATMLCSIAGIENKTIDNSAAYIKSWLSALKNDQKLLIQAGTRAQQACDHILNRTYGEYNDTATIA